MELLRFREDGKLGNGIKLAKELTDDLARVIAAAQALEFPEDPAERRFGLRDGAFRVVLAVPLQTLVMLTELLTEEFSQALARRAKERP